MLSIMASDYTIESFWISSLPNLVRPASPLRLTGWTTKDAANVSFIEADLKLRPGQGDLSSPIWFVAAPGAVGKSTLAKEISARTGAVYVDLAVADTVAGNSLTGGLVKTGLLSAWEQSRTTLLVDALDEARLRVTQGSFDDFLRDITSLVSGRRIPIVLFGRVGIVEEAWAILEFDHGLRCPIFDIGFFDEPRAVRFLMAQLRLLAAKKHPEMDLGTNRAEELDRNLRRHPAVYEKVAVDFVKAIRIETRADGDRFFGYAPVLQAVARMLAEETNPSGLGAPEDALKQQHVLQHLSSQVLTRESAKLGNQLPSKIPASDRHELYLPEEQLSRLAARVLTTPPPPTPSGLRPEYAAAYDAAVKELLPQHPFLDGTGQSPAGAVFAAAISAHALFSSTGAVTEKAERYAGTGPHTPNPFLHDFYLERAKSKDGDKFLMPPEHISLFYDSVRAGAGVGDIVRLTVEGDDSNDDADVEILFESAERPGSPRIFQFRTSQAGTIKFGRSVNGVHIDAPLVDVEIGAGGPVEMVAPVSMNVASLKINCSELVIVRSDMSNRNEDAAVILEAQELTSSTMPGPPILRKGAEFSVNWPGAIAYPWSSFALAPTQHLSSRMDEALRALRRLILAFRSHSKGQLARYKGKIEHARMTKGVIGEQVRTQLVRDGVLSLQAPMYFLDPDALGRVVGANFQDVKMKRYNQRVLNYVDRALTAQG